MVTRRFSVSKDIIIEMEEYFYNRLCFKADIIEPLKDTDEFAIHTPFGVFKMTKADFYNTFPNIVKTESYQKGRIYHMAKPPKKAMQFLVGTSPRMNIKSKKDLIGSDIREKIREIGKMWRDSDCNPSIDDSILLYWDNVIKKWAEDEKMPLIIRKDIRKKGQVFIHSSGREIIVSDNTFAIWIFNCVMNNITYSLSQLREMLFNNEIPMVFVQTDEIRERGKYIRPLGSFSLPDWKVCHIDSIGFNSRKRLEELDIASIKRHFCKYASPLNMFVLPKEIGDLGEIQIFIDEQKRVIKKG